MSEKTDAARFIAKILAKRPTPLDEVSGVIAGVQDALSRLGAEPKATPMPEGATRKPQRTMARDDARPQKQAASPRQKALPQPKVAPPAVAAAPTQEPKPSQQPILVRRATVTNGAPPAPAPLFASTSSNSVRGVVQWFDSRTGQGTLRLPGQSHDLPIDAATLGAFGIPRLFKGQEVEATLAGSGDTPKIVALHLANAIATSPVSGGLVRDRHAKTVVVELKREALSRSAARAEAESLLRPRRAR